MLVGTLNNLAVVYEECDRFGPAEAGVHRAPCGSGRNKWRPEPDDTAAPPGAAVVWHNLARLYRDTGRVQPADEAFRNAVAEQRKVVAGTGTPSTAPCSPTSSANQGWHFH